MLTIRDLVGVDPVPPDFHYCNPVYGQALSVTECTELGDNLLPHGQETVDYFLRDMGALTPNTLPFSISQGGCVISVEHAGPDFTAPTYIPLIPDDIRGMAGDVIRHCVAERYALGGFVTKGLASVFNYIAHSGAFTPSPDPTDLWFVTVTVTGPERKLFKPGDTDPSIPQILASKEFDTLNAEPFGSYLTEFFLQNGMKLWHRSMDMERGSSETWWSTSIDPPDEMTYECDVKLGSPAVVDCAKIQYQDLGHASDSVQIGPGTPKLFTEGSCTLIISATTSLALTWAHIQAGLDALLNACVENPLYASRGGRAFFGPNSPLPVNSRTRRKREVPITGLNALPAGANLTVVAATYNAVKCAWAAAQEEKSVSACGRT